MAISRLNLVKENFVTKNICELKRGKRRLIREILFLRHLQEVLGQLCPELYAATMIHSPKSLKIHICYPQIAIFVYLKEVYTHYSARY